MGFTAQQVENEIFRLAGDDYWSEVNEVFFWGPESRKFSEELNAWIEGERVSHDIDGDAEMVFSVQEAETGVVEYFMQTGYYSSYGDGYDWDGSFTKAKAEQKWITIYTPVRD